MKRRIISLSGDLDAATAGGGGGGAASATLVAEHKDLQDQYRDCHAQLTKEQRTTQILKDQIARMASGGGGGDGGGGGGGSFGSGSGGGVGGGGGRMTRSSAAKASSSSYGAQNTRALEADQR